MQQLWALPFESWIWHLRFPWEALPPCCLMHEQKDLCLKLWNPLLHFCEGDCIARFYANQEFPKSEMIKFENWGYVPSAIAIHPERSTLPPVCLSHFSLVALLRMNLLPFDGWDLAMVGTLLRFCGSLPLATNSMRCAVHSTWPETKTRDEFHQAFKRTLQDLNSLTKCFLIFPTMFIIFPATERWACP